MESDSSEALRVLTTAMEAHLDAVRARRGPEDAAVDDAYDAVAEAFERYEEALDDEFGETLPFVTDDSDDDDDDDGDFDDDDDDDDSDDAFESLDAHAEEDEDEMDDDIVEFDLKS